MKIGVIGTGYVGLVSGVCFAEMGNNVICMDNDRTKIAMLNDLKVPIYEPGLEPMLLRNYRGGRLSFTDDIAATVAQSLLIFIAVGTPQDKDGSADLQYVRKVAEDIGSSLNDYKIIITKSTVPVGTCFKIKEIIQKKLDERGVAIEFDVASNPEFLKEGSAIADCMKPDRVIVGTDNVRVAAILKELYGSFMRREENFINMDVLSSELTKYAANAMLATKISFMNEMSKICEKVGADIENIRLGIGSDSRIGYSFIYPGLGYGGSCFPKDVRALIKTCEDADYCPKLLGAVDRVNDAQKSFLVDKVVEIFGNDLKGLHFALWGLSFKPDTDDIREAPALKTIEQLIGYGAKIRAYDPVANANVKELYPGEKNLALFDDQYEVLEGCDGLLIATEWKQFRSPDFEKIGNSLRRRYIFDGRNIYKQKDMERYRFTYLSVGRSVIGVH